MLWLVTSLRLMTGEAEADFYEYGDTGDKIDTGDTGDKDDTGDKSHPGEL